MKIKTQAAACAHFIRQDLKRVFPDIKFSVRSANFSMGNSVDVDWVDGPSRDEVENLLCQYEYGKFDGMTDYYEITNHREDIPQTKYLMCNRRCSVDHSSLDGQGKCPKCEIEIRPWF